MSEIISIHTKKTDKTFTDFSRPALMKKADRLFKKFNAGKSGQEVLSFILDINEQLTSTPFHKIEEEFWPKVEKVINDGRPIKPTNDETGIEKYGIALSFFYNALDVIDTEDNINNLAALRNVFYQTATHVTTKIVNHQDAKYQRILRKIMTTIDYRMEKVAKRFNERVQNEEIYGPEISLD